MYKVFVYSIFLDTLTLLKNSLFLTNIMTTLMNILTEYLNNNDINMFDNRIWQLITHLVDIYYILIFVRMMNISNVRQLCQ